MPWYPRTIAHYAPADTVNWSQRLDEDLRWPNGRPAVTVQRRPAARDFYCHDLADAAFMERKPVSFVVFGKPGVPDEELATALSSYWGCVHVSLAKGLAAGRADELVPDELRNGAKVNVAAIAAANANPAKTLTMLLGLDTTEVRHRGYVLTGLPRYCQSA